MSRSHALVESLEDRQLFASVNPWTVPAGTKLTVDRPFVVFNDVRGGSASPTVKLTLRNKSTSSVTVNGLFTSGGDASQFLITAKPAAGSFVIAAGKTAIVSLAYSAPSTTALGLHATSLKIASNDPTLPSLTVPLRGLATIGTGGTNEPSLQRIFDLYQLTLRSGDPNPSTTYLFSKTEIRGANDEVTAQSFVKAGTGAVTIQPLATFAGGSPSAIVGWYKSGNTASKAQLFSVSGSTAQSVNPLISGVTSFDPGTNKFGLYASFPFLGTTAYSQDSLNTVEKTIKRKIRVFPLKIAGVTQANAYVFTAEDYNNDPTNGTDSNDVVAIIRNVKIAV